MSEHRILDYIIKSRKGHYCHAFELASVYDFICLIDSLIEQLQNVFDEPTTNKDFISFIGSASIYYIEDKSLTEEQNNAREQELYNFDFGYYIKEQIQ